MEQILSYKIIIMAIMWLLVMLVESDWNGIEIGRNRNMDRPGNYYLDEVRVWGAALSESDIKCGCTSR